MQVSLIGAPTDIGASTVGCRLGPGALRAGRVVGEVRSVARDPEVPYLGLSRRELAHLREHALGKRDQQREQRRRRAPEGARRDGRALGRGEADHGHRRRAGGEGDRLAEGAGHVFVAVLVAAAPHQLGIEHLALAREHQVGGGAVLGPVAGGAEGQPGMISPFSLGAPPLRISAK